MTTCPGLQCTQSNLKRPANWLVWLVVYEDSCHEIIDYQRKEYETVLGDLA